MNGITRARAVRTCKGFRSAISAAVAIGIKPNRYRRWEGGHKCAILKDNELEKVCAFFGVDRSELADNRGYPVFLTPEHKDVG